MSDSTDCPNCGTPIPAGSPEQLCPKCLIGAGVESRVESSAVDPAQQATVQSPAESGFVPPSPAELATQFSQLEILELLGKGGMGAVYKARQSHLDRIVAVKILPAEIGRDTAFAERFMREARALAKLSHPHIVMVFDFGRTPDGMFYFVMEHVDGVNLRQAMRSGAMPPEQALAIVPQICEALQFAHDEGIVHRDIKPENILLDKKGRVKIADFGLAKLVGLDAGDLSLTGTRQVMGTLKYMAPEQLEGAKSVDHRADIFSLGVVFYELLTGELPLGRFAPPSRKVQLDIRLDEIVLRALEKEPAMRWQQASEVKSELDGVRTTLAPIPTVDRPMTAVAQERAVPADGSNSEGGTLRMRGANALLSVGILMMWPVLLPLLYFAPIDYRTAMNPAPTVAWSVLYSLVAAVFAFRGAHSLRCGENSSSPRTACILAMLPLSPTFLVGLPVGWWVLGLLARPELQAARTTSSALPVPESPLQDRPFYVAGKLTGLLLRQKWFLVGGQIVASLVYLMAIVTFFSIHATSSANSYVLTIGAPTPWLTDEVTSTSSRLAVHLLTWSYIPAGIALFALAIGRQLEFLEKGKVHSMAWHYTFWALFLVISLGIGILGRVSQQRMEANVKSGLATPEANTAR